MLLIPSLFHLVLNYQLPSSTAQVPFLPDPSGWKWNSLWLGVQAEGLWGLGWGFSLSGASPFFKSPSEEEFQGDAE